MKTDSFKRKMVRLVLPIAFQQFMLALVLTIEGLFDKMNCSNIFSRKDIAANFFRIL